MWFLRRLFAGVAAILVLVVAAGTLLTLQYSGTPQDWAASQDADAAWVGSWEDTDTLSELLGTGSMNTLYVYAGDVAEDGTVARVEGTAELLSWLDSAHPEVRPLAWLRHVESGSSLLRDRLPEEARRVLAPEVAAIGADGFAGVHLEIRPVTVNDPSIPTLMAMVREELGEDAVLSVQAQHVELLPGGRVLSFVAGGEEKYWSKGYLDRVAEHADEVVLPGVDSNMPTEGMYGGFMVRQASEAVAALGSRKDLTLRFGVPTYDDPGWGPVRPGEDALTAIAALRLGLSRAEPPEGLTTGVALYLAEQATKDDVRAYRTAWLDPLS